MSLPDQVPLVEVDAGQIERALVNLLENALKFSSPQGHVFVAVDVGVREVVVAVRDDGVGLASEDLDAIFEPFQRGSGSSDRAGAGLGLAIVRGFAQANGGRVWAESAARGATFFLCAAHGRDRSRDARMSRNRILVVDDEPQILRALKTNLSAAGYEVETAASGEEALASAATDPPDALILDLVLPDRSGTDITRELRTWTSVPIIVLSAVGDEREKVEALDAGADDYVTKPFGMEELLARLRASLRRSSPSNDPVIVLGMLTLDLEKKALFVNGELVSLTPHEFDLLRLLATNEGKLLTHRAILREVWGPTYGNESHYLHVYISQLRRKIEPDPARPRYLLTEPGAGYRLVNPTARES